jgi:hypothetical protein
MENLVLINMFVVKNVMAEGLVTTFQRLSFIHYNLQPRFEYSKSGTIMLFNFIFTHTHSSLY